MLTADIVLSVNRNEITQGYINAYAKFSEKRDAHLKAKEALAIIAEELKIANRELKENIEAMQKLTRDDLLLATNEFEEPLKCKPKIKPVNDAIQNIENSIFGEISETPVLTPTPKLTNIARSARRNAVFLTREEEIQWHSIMLPSLESAINERRVKYSAIAEGTSIRSNTINKLVTRRASSPCKINFIKLKKYMLGHKRIFGKLEVSND